MGLVFLPLGVLHLNLPMVKPEKRSYPLFSFIIVALLIGLRCGDIPYVPDETAVIYLDATPTSIQSGQTSTIRVTGEKASGYPLPDGTTIYLFTSVGRVEPEVSLRNGQVKTIYQSDTGQNREAIITARSGQAIVSPEQLVITVNEIEEPDIAYLFISANPLELPREGGKSSIQVLGLDRDMAPVAGKNIWLETTAGSLSVPGLNITDADGEINLTLITDHTATVTACHKDISASVTITVEP